MVDRDKVIRHIIAEICIAKVCKKDFASVDIDMLSDALTLLKEQDSLLGIQQTADSITFTSTGTAQQGEERGVLLGKAIMRDWLEKELLYRGLLTDDIRTVFDEANNL